jgi:hypothetical protein
LRPNALRKAHLPELGTDLVTALATLDVNDLAHCLYLDRIDREKEWADLIFSLNRQQASIWPTDLDRSHPTKLAQWQRPIPNTNPCGQKGSCG